MIDRKFIQKLHSFGATAQPACGPQGPLLSIPHACGIVLSICRMHWERPRRFRFEKDVFWIIGVIILAWVMVVFLHGRK